MDKVRFAGLVCTNEIKPKFPPKVQAIWDECGTFVTSMEAEQGAKEIEFFVERMIQSVVEYVDEFDDAFWHKEQFIQKGYFNE